MRESISSNHYSVDTQAADALSWLECNAPKEYAEIKDRFPEEMLWDGCWLDTEYMNVDVEWGSWLIDAIEATGLVWWEEGEPWIGDNEDDDNE